MRSKNEILVDLLEELIAASDYYGEGPYPVEYSLLDEAATCIGKKISEDRLNLLNVCVCGTTIQIEFKYCPECGKKDEDLL